MKNLVSLLSIAIFVSQGASAATLALSGEGTADSPYTVASSSDWNTLATYIAENADDLSGKYVKLTADIDFTDAAITPLGYDLATAFNGDLDGGGKTIKGFSYSSTAKYSGGLITYAGKTSVIHDFTAEGTVSTAYSYTGGIFGKFYGTAQNLVAKIDVTSSASHCAGIAGYAFGGSSMTGCVNEGSITSSSYAVAGLVGMSAAGAEKYEDCVNRGTITYTGTATSGTTYVAGLIAMCYATTMTNCHNEGDVVAANGGGMCCGLVAMCAANTASSEVSAYSWYMTNCYNCGAVTGYSASGLVGTCSNSTRMVMESCYNSGAVTATGTSPTTNCYCGGLASGTFGTCSSYNNCYNTGAVTSYGTQYTGGLFGYYRSTSSYYTSTQVTNIVNCHNEGDVVAAGSHAGGIIAYQYKYVVIDSCYNTGNVQGSLYVGGIAGQIGATDGAIISNSYNAGNVTASGCYVGGILGYTANNPTITCCFNVGNVTTTNETQGYDTSSGYAVGGIAGFATATFSNVYSAGAISGATAVGGIIGTTYIASTSPVYASVSGAYFSGTISAPVGSSGNVIGISTSDTAYWDAENNTISGAYYLAENAVDCIDAYSAGITRAQLAALDLGEGWTAGDNYTYPRITTIADNDYAKAHAAAVVPQDSDSYSSITTNFNIGTPDGVTWTASVGSVEIDGNNATFSESYSGTLTMTATSGEVSVATELICDVTVSGISETAVDSGRDVVAERFYTASGAQVAAPAEDAKAVYIVVRTYSDGTSEAVKEVR